MMLHERYESAAAILTNGEAPAWSSDSAKLLEAYGIGIHQARIIDFSSSKDALQSIELEGGTSLQVRFGLVSMGLFKVYNELALQLGAVLGDEGKPSDQRHVQIDARGETSVQNLLCGRGFSAAAR